MIKTKRGSKTKKESLVVMMIEVDCRDGSKDLPLDPKRAHDLYQAGAALLSIDVTNNCYCVPNNDVISPRMRREFNEFADIISAAIKDGRQIIKRTKLS